MFLGFFGGRSRSEGESFEAHRDMESPWEAQEETTPVSMEAPPASSIEADPAESSEAAPLPSEPVAQEVTEQTITPERAASTGLAARDFTRVALAREVAS